MKLGFGLYKHMLNEEHTTVLLNNVEQHTLLSIMVDYFNQGNKASLNNQPIGDLGGWGNSW